MGNTLRANIHKLRIFDTGKKRINKNLNMEIENVVEWCSKEIANPHNVITKKGKNLYVYCEDYTITINASTYTIITAHKN